MAMLVRDVMTPEPISLSADTPVTRAAREMRERGIGPVVVMEPDGGGIRGIATDRDIVVRAVAEELDPGATRIDDIASHDVATVRPDDPEDEAVRLMRERALRRLPVVEGDRPVGIVSIGDLALDMDPDSALADISAAPPNG